MYELFINFECRRQFSGCATRESRRPEQFRADGSNLVNEHLLLAAERARIRIVLFLARVLIHADEVDITIAPNRPAAPTVSGKWMSGTRCCSARPARGERKKPPLEIDAAVDLAAIRGFMKAAAVALPSPTGQRKL